MRISDWSSDVCSSDLLTTLVQVRTRRSLNDVLQDLVSGREPSADAKLLYVAPGRVNAAQATILALRSQLHQEFYAVMWPSLQSRRAGGPASPPPPPALPPWAGHIGSASCRGRVWQYMSHSVAAVT